MSYHDMRMGIPELQNRIASLDKCIESIKGKISDLDERIDEDANEKEHLNRVLASLTREANEYIYRLDELQNRREMSEL